LVIAAGVWFVLVHVADEPEVVALLLLLSLLVLLLCSEHEAVTVIWCWFCGEWDLVPSATAALVFDVDRVECCEWSDSPNPEIAEAPVPDSGTKKVEAVEF
jgi:hypothetical protein